MFGEDFVRQLYARYCVSIYRKRNLIYIHIPKAGGTSIAKALFGRRAGHLYAKDVSHIMGSFHFKQLFSFSLVRNPYDRIVSAYHFVVQGGSKEGAIRHNAAFRSNDFKTFSDFVKKWLIFQDPLNIDLVFRPQYLFVTDDDGSIMVSRVGKLEAFDDLKEEIFEKFGIKLNGKRLNRSHHADFKNYYDPELKQLVFNFYRKDFELFDYPENL